MYFDLNPEKATIEKLSKMIKSNGELQGTLGGLKDSVRGSFSQAVHIMFNLACNKSPNAALWFMALFYAVSSEPVQLFTDIQQPTVQISKRDFSEMTKTHSSVINRQKAFRTAVLDMANLEHLECLLNLIITPDEHLSKLIKWQNSYSFHVKQQGMDKICKKHPKIKEQIQGVKNLMDQLIRKIMNKSLPCKLLKEIIKRKQQINRYFLGENMEKFQKAIKEAEEEFKRLESRKSKVKVLSDLNQDLPVDVKHLETTLLIDLDKEERSLKTIMDTLFSEEPGSDTYFLNAQPFEKINCLRTSTYFKELWRKTANHVKDTEFRDIQLIPLDEVYDEIYKPAFKDFKNSYETLRDLSMSLQDLKTKLGNFLDNMSKELKTMGEVFGDDKDEWIQKTEEHIERYRALQAAKENADVIIEMKNNLGLCGDFDGIDNIEHTDGKRLCDLSESMLKVGNKLMKIPKQTVSFLRELNECIRRGFISWIKEIIKDTAELTAFVELASISAGENTMDIDKVCCFRDAISATAPIIYHPSENLEELLQAVKKIQRALESDEKLKDKLRDSCANMEWLKIAYETHGSVERSSLQQATDINESGIYSIKIPSGAQTKIYLEDCITLRCKENVYGGHDVKCRTYNLAELQELQNKLMLITVSVKNREDEITTYIEVLEQMINVGKCFLELRDAGHILFQDWEMAAYCGQAHDIKIWVKFGITSVEIKGYRQLLDELKGLCESMRGCLSEWLKYIEQKRNTYYHLNYFTAKQLVYLCCSLAEFRIGWENISTGLLNMLSIIKDSIKEDDVKNALIKALETPVDSGGSQESLELKKFLNDYPDIIEYFLDTGYREEQIKAAIKFCEEDEQVPEDYNDSETTEEYRNTVMECIDDHENDDEWVQEWYEKYEERRECVLKNQMKFKGGLTTEEVSFSMTEEQIEAAFANLENSDEKIAMLWKTYHNKLSGLVSDKFVDLDVLGETMNHLSKSAEVTVKRKLPIILEGGKPNLISCKDVEMLPLCLSLYNDKDQPLPAYDEVLVCTSDTTAEEVELIIRRAVQSGSMHEKIYCLLNAEKLNHDVSRKFESIFYQKTQETHVQGDMYKRNYQFIILCDSKAHQSYVATAFDMYKRTVTENLKRNEEIKQYLLHKHQTSPEDETGFMKLNQPDQFQLKTKLIFSEHAGMGKSLYAKNLVKVSEENLKNSGFTYKTIRMSQSQLRTEDIVSQLQQYEDKPMEKVPRIFHFDIPPVVTKGLYTFLLQLFVLRCFHSPDGTIWRCNDSHIYLVEYTKKKYRECDQHCSEISPQVEDVFLEMLPTVKCLSPEETLSHLEQMRSCDKDYQLMDDAEFRSEAFQRTYQYFKIYRLKPDQLEGFSFNPRVIEDSPKEWLECLLQFCGVKNPSWGELRNFTHFLNSQLKKCEQSVFCSPALKDDLTGFKKFVVKFMMTMSKDFSIRSLKTSDDSDEKVQDAAAEDMVLKEFQLRRRWEQQAHPYILFNADNESMTFLGFHIHNLDAVDARTKVVVEEKIIDKTLFNQLKAQRVPFNIDFEEMPREDQLDIIGRVLGVQTIEDPDDTYQLTLDNVMKILAIHLRFESDIPVIIMGETGCGKTRLVQFMCDLLRSGKQRQNLIVVRVHGGTSSEVIYSKVRRAIEISKENEAHKLDTVLFFDEANTTEAVNAIKEVICDKSVNGEQIDAPRLKIIAACNPYRKHSKEAIEQLERAGLGYRVRSENTEEKLGQIPMRQLVYRVQPLPPSLTPLVWDFGKLNELTQELYITQMVKTFFRKEELPNDGHQALFTKVISASQKHMAELTDECRMVSLRDIERCMKTVMWFYRQRKKLFKEIDKKKEAEGSKGIHDDLVRSLILAIGVCYLASLENRNKYLEQISKAFSLSSDDIQKEIEFCKEAFISNVDCPTSVAKNNALKENVFMMVVCMNLRIPLFLVGKPGSSKSLSKTIAAHAMQGKASPNNLFKGYKQAQLASFQCSPHSTPDGIISIFRQCAQFQYNKNLDEYVAVVVLDEIGLAEDSPKMPLKTLHPLLEYGCVDDESPDEFKKVGFIGISNWSLDPAKMNRGILVLRTSPLAKELKNTARDICSSDKEAVNNEIRCLIPKLTKFYLRVLEEQKTEFFGLRDFYSLVKLIMCYAIKANGRPADEDLTRAVQRNFDGLDSLNVLEIFWDFFMQRTEECDTVSLLRENLDIETSGFTSRYLLLPTVNHAALQILKSQKIIDESNVEIIFGSGFPHDEEYSQVCRTVNRIKTCMETGRPVVLLNIQSLYESLYDALNQCYVKLGGSYYVDLGLGSHRVKCRVKDEFRLIVIEEKSTVYEQFPTPLLNRLEKHCLEISNILPDHGKELQAELEEWLNKFVTQDSSESDQLITTKKKYDTIVGYTEDTCASVLLHCCPQIVSRELDHDEREKTLEMAQEMLLQCATPDSVLRATKYMEENSEKLLEVYFSKQPHGNLIKALKTYREHETDGICLEVSTYSRLLNKRDVEKISKELGIADRDSCLFLLNEFYTEQSFSQAVSEFLGIDKGARKLLLLQSYFDDPRQSQRLLFCVRHSITQIKTSFSDGTAFDIVLLTSLPRISGGCGYIATFEDGWVSLHMDELIATPGFPGDIYELQCLTISESLAKSSFPATGNNPDMDIPKAPLCGKQDVLVDTLLLMKKSLQKGILQLRDKADNTQRATTRVEILHGLLQKKYTVSDAFIKSMERRIVSFLSEQEKIKGKENWVVAQALSDGFVAEGSSFRHVLWVHLEDTVASALAHILAVIDGDNNLDNLINNQPTEKTDFWLRVFQEDQWDLLKIPVTTFQGQVSVLSTSGDQTKSCTCHFPFSWALKEKFDEIWSCVISLKGPAVRPAKEYLEKFEELIPLPWIKSITKDHNLFANFSEDLVNISMPLFPHDLNKSFSETLTRLTPRLYHDLTGNDPEGVPLPWLYVVNKYMHDNHQLLYSLFLQNTDVVTAGEATEALNQVLQGLQPKESELKDFNSCQQWLKKVKSVSVAVDLILSEDSLVTRHAENAETLLTKIRLFWQSTWIIYLLMDHLLQNEQEMEKKLLTILVRHLLFAWKKLNSEEGKQMESVIDHVTAILAKCNKNACNVFIVVCGYCDKDFTEDDTAEVECGHMFHLSCLREHSDTQCRKCKKQITQDYKPCGVVAKETFLKVNRFRRKCNSFFVEFMWNFISSKEQLTEKVLNKLMDYVGCSPAPEVSSVRSTLEQYMRPDPAVQSLILKILLKCGMEETAPELQRFIEGAVKSNDRNSDDIYFMVVRSIEDHIHFSSQGRLIKEAIKCLSTCVFSESDQNMIAKDLHTIAKLRFAITVASDAIRTVLSKAGTVDAEDSKLLQNLKELLSNTGNPWIQIFLLRNICETHGSSFIYQLGQSETFWWTIPRQVLKEQQDMSKQTVDQFQMYGEMYKKITLDSFRALEEPSHEIAQEFDDGSPCFYVCMALAAVRQASHNTASTNNEGSLISKMKMKSITDPSWGQLVKICLSEIKDCSLSQIVLHTALVAQVSSGPEMKLLNALCFNPGQCKKGDEGAERWFQVQSCRCAGSVALGMLLGYWTFLSIEWDALAKNAQWNKPQGQRRVECAFDLQDKDTFKLTPGLPWLFNTHSEPDSHDPAAEKDKATRSVQCGRPNEKSKCASCGNEVGGEGYVPVEGFTEFNDAQGSGRGHNLGDPNNRKEQDGKRSLYGANLHMVRALIHSSMLWGTSEHTEEVQNLIVMPQGAHDVRKYLLEHLRKDIELLAKALGKSEQDAEMTVHLFLKLLLESSSEPNIQIQITDSEEKREEWEKNIYQRLQVFFQTFEAQLLEVQSNILKLSGMDTLAQLIYSKEPALEDLPTSGVFNLPLMWSFEQRMTIQRFSHLIEQKDERRNVPLLSELLKSHVHIQHLRYLPQVLSLQQKLMYYFENLDLQCYSKVPINTFMKEHVADHEQQEFSKSADIVKTLWKHLKSINYLQIPAEVKDKHEDDLKILDLLPTECSVTRIITKYLVQMQNNFIQMTNPNADREITVNELKPSHVITCVPEQDFLTIAISNIDHVVYQDGKQSTNYNFKTVESQIIDRFFAEKPKIKVTTVPLFEYNTGTTLRAFFSKVQDKLEPLNTNDRNCIMNDFRFLNEISAALSTLRIVIGFLKLSFPSPELKLVMYLKKDLKLEDRAHTLNLQVLRSSQVKHIQSLWEALSLRQSSLLIEMNQNPFIMIEDQQFHEMFTKNQEEENMKILADITELDILITELHYVILNMKLKEVQPKWTIMETFDAFCDCDEINKKAIECLKVLPEMKMKYGIALWKLAVQIKKGIKNTKSV
ncbi:E3 ubiquitin-protein ligase rnf213-alpha-like [Clarias gariepinus]